MLNRAGADGCVYLGAIGLGSARKRWIMGYSSREEEFAWKLQQ